MFRKHDHDKILTRLVQILTKLYYGETLCVSDLAEEFNVSTRTIQRDMNQRLAGFPLEKEGRCWKMKEGFRLEAGLSADDQVTLGILERMAESLGSVFGSRSKAILRRLASQDPGPIYIKTGLDEIGEKLEEFKALKEAVAGKRAVRFRYDSPKGSKQVAVHPLRIVNYEGYWYLLALEPDSALVKKYRFDRLSRVEATDEPFTFDASVEEMLDDSVNIWFQPTGDRFGVKLYLKPGAAAYLKNRPVSRTQRLLESHEDGGAVISVSITSDMEILPTIRYWFPEVFVLEPRRLRERMAADIGEYLGFAREIGETGTE